MGFEPTTFREKKPYALRAMYIAFVFVKSKIKNLEKK